MVIVLLLLSELVHPLLLLPLLSWLGFGCSGNRPGCGGGLDGGCGCCTVGGCALLWHLSFVWWLCLRC